MHVHARRAPAGRQDHHHAVHGGARGRRKLPRPVPADGARAAWLNTRDYARRRMAPSPVFAERGTKEEIEHGLGFQPGFDAEGLIPAIVTEAISGEVLMFAWMNAEAIALTLETRVGHFWSRSRQALWKKGEESGNVL